MALTYTELQSVATKLIEKKLVENVLNTNALTAFLTKSGKLKLRDGGELLSFPITIGDENDSTGAWYEGSEALDSSEYEAISSAVYNWRNIHETIKLSHPELNKASGDAAKLDLLATRVRLAKEYLAHRIGTAVHSGTNVKDFVGLSTIMSTSATLGGVAVADLPEWIANVLSNSSVDRALTLALIQSLDGGCTFDNKSPDLHVGRQNVYDKLWNLVVPFQRLEAYDQEMAGLGFKKVPVINGIPFIIDSKCAAKTIQAINSEHLFIVAHQNENMKVVSHENLEGSDAIQRRVFFMGALCCDGRRYQGSLQDILVT